MAGGSMALGQERMRGAEAHTDPFDVVYEAHHAYVYGLVHALLGNTQDAEDVTQEVFLTVYKALPTYKPERAGMRTWLAKVTVNACRGHRRRNFLSRLWQRADSYSSEALNDVEDLSLLGAPEDQALHSEMRRILGEALAKLRDEHRVVLVLHYYLDMPCQEIARLLECPEGTVYSRLYYARRTVQAHLERRTSHRKAANGKA
ncbi:MAG: RNA polymerase sigma factor [Chloroflexia bacterium]